MDHPFRETLYTLQTNTLKMYSVHNYTQQQCEGFLTFNLLILKSVGASLGIKASKSSWDVAVIFKVEEGSSIWESWHLIRLSKIPCQSLTNRVGNW